MRSGKSIAKAASSFTFGKDCYLMEQNQLALLKHRLPPERKTWLVTGGAGFIGSHLVEALLQLGQKVIILDNFSSGKPANIDDAVRNADEDTRRLLRIMEGDIADPAVCFRAMEGVDYVLHQAALASVPASLEDPVAFDRTNVGGTLRIFEAARQEGISRVVFASSSAVYGDDCHLPKVEEHIGIPLSPYAASKAITETWAETYATCYGMDFFALRYFNVYGPRQDPNGAYAAVIPQWMNTVKENKRVYINGDGSTTRDFIYIDDIVTTNLLAATAPSNEGVTRLNVAGGKRTSLIELFKTIRSVFRESDPSLEIADAIHRDFRTGDIRHSTADLSRLESALEFRPGTALRDGLRRILPR